jgi:uncharacterized Zn finger protein
MMNRAYIGEFNNMIYQMERGRYERARQISASIEFENGQITSVVQGSKGNTYSVVIHLGTAKTFCSCQDKDRLCKHIGAALIQWGRQIRTYHPHPQGAS